MRKKYCGVNKSFLAAEKKHNCIRRKESAEWENIYRDGGL